MITVGEKIKSLRKDLKLTQTDLAGQELTKSMLSQIENNKSNPSLKTLKYLAERLNAPISYFLEATDRQENDIPNSIDVTGKQEALIETVNEFIEAGQINEAMKEAETLLMGNLQNNVSKLTADIIQKLGITLFHENNLEKAQKYLDYSIQAYIKGAFYLEGAKAYIELAKIYYQKLDYSECLSIADKVLSLYDKSISKDSLLEIEVYYYKIIVLFAIGDLRQTTDVIRKAIELSEKTSIYYKTDEIYRLNAIFHFLMSSTEAYEQNIEKALQFAELTKDNNCLGRIYAMKGIVAVENNNAEAALKYADMNKQYLGREIYIYHLIKARAYYLLEDYKLAFKAIKKVDYPSYETHKFDYLNMWSAKVQEGLILSKLGKHSEAVAAIRIGIDKMSVVGDSKFLIFAYKSVSEIYSCINDFQHAFAYLKIANEIQDRINGDENMIF